MKIAKCPWCGEEAEVTHAPNIYAYVRCKNEECMSCGPTARPQKWKRNKAHAVSEWNRVSEAVWGKEQAYTQGTVLVQQGE